MLCIIISKRFLKRKHQVYVVEQNPQNVISVIISTKLTIHQLKLSTLHNRIHSIIMVMITITPFLIKPHSSNCRAFVGY